MFQRQLQINWVEISKQKALDAAPRAIQQTEFQGLVEGADGTNIRL